MPAGYVFIRVKQKNTIFVNQNNRINLSINEKKNTFYFVFFS